VTLRTFVAVAISVGVGASTLPWTATTALAQCTCEIASPSSTAQWQQLSPQTSPPGRANGVVVYDAQRKRLVLIGGMASCTNRVPVADFTWEFDGTTWIAVSTVTTPPGRYHPAAAYDRQRHRVVLFGGNGGNGGIGDTWEYDGVNWTEVTTPHTPGPCSTPAMAYDETRNVIVLRLGIGAGEGCPAENTTWEYDGTDWVQVVTATNPPWDNSPSLFFDSGRGVVVLFGGEETGQNRAWDYDGVDYSLRQTFACSDNAIAYDRDRLLFVGGVQTGNPALPWSFNPMREWDTFACSAYQSSATAPPQRTTAPAAYFEARGEVILYGGYEYCTGQNFSDTWRYVNDSDGDGFGDVIDCASNDPTVYPGAPQLCDGRNNNCGDPLWPAVPANEFDADGDGYRGCDECDDSAPSVHPGAGEVCNGIDDNCNGQIDDDAAGVDSDGDGAHNACDNCRFVANPTQTDSDGDHVGNACDNCINAPNPSQADADGDGRGDACDNCPTIPNGFQDDTDADHVGDACDNCPLDFNPAQSDFNHDGEGDHCDLNDGLIYVYSTDKNYREWQAESGFTTWNSYRGSLATLRAAGQYTQAPGSNPLAARDCGLTDLYVFDPDIPAPGEVAFNLVTGVAGGVESSLGTNSAGVPRTNANPCP